MNWLKRAIRPILREMKVMDTDWCLRHIDPLHDDVPMLVLRRHALEIERKGSVR